MKRNLFVIIGMVLAVWLMVAACSPRPQTTPQETQPSAQPAAATQAPQTGGQAASEGTAPGASTGESGIREDIPIMEAARNVQASRGGQTVVYEADGDIDTVVNFYKEQLPNYGWEMAGPPDTSLPAIATMLRENEAGERMTINMAGNTLGGFVKVTISVVPSN
ncbi:MAG TPA: hypothetical protein VE136_00530 [Anaerolineales bacterium]|jgi:hypothetical protein|nr:hypothetical protein [Anaerolineales bacterium]